MAHKAIQVLKDLLDQREILELKDRRDLKV